MRTNLRALVPLFSAVLLTSPAWAEDAAPPTTKSRQQQKKTAAPKMDLGLGGIGGDLPSADGLKGKTAPAQGISPKITAQDVKYEVVKVEHAQAFTRTAAGARPVGSALQTLKLYGQPPMTPKFSTLVRVKATRNINTSIEVVILDPRGDTALSGNGEVSFHGSKNGEVDWLIDWDPVARPSGGDYKMLVRVGGEPKGTWPINVVVDKQ